MVYRLIDFKNKTSVVCDLEIGILSEPAEMMLIYSTDMYDLENIEKYVLFQEKYVLFQKLQWPLIQEVAHVPARLRQQAAWHK